MNGPIPTIIDMFRLTAWSKPSRRGSITEFLESPAAPVRAARGAAQRHHNLRGAVRQSFTVTVDEESFSACAGQDRDSAMEYRVDTMIWALTA
jgi:hypothetical protein